MWGEAAGLEEGLYYIVLLLAQDAPHAMHSNLTVSWGSSLGLILPICDLETVWLAFRISEGMESPAGPGTEEAGVEWPLCTISVGWVRSSMPGFSSSVWADAWVETLPVVT